jgi:hypothetical protein
MWLAAGYSLSVPEVSIGPNPKWTSNGGADVVGCLAGIVFLISYLKSALEFVSKREHFW